MTWLGIILLVIVPVGVVLMMFWERSHPKGDTHADRMAALGRVVRAARGEEEVRS